MAPFLDGVQLSTEPLRGGSLLFTTKSPGGSSTHLTEIGKMKG